MLDLSWTVPMGEGRTARVVSTRSGDFAAPPTGRPQPRSLLRRRAAVVDRPWTWFRQVHGSRVLRVVRPGEWAGVEADGAYTTETGPPISVTTADCAPVVLVADNGIAVVHAGWRGAIGGIIETAGELLRSAGGTPVATLLGPSIGPEYYEFDPVDLARIVGTDGEAVAAATLEGRPALDMYALISGRCERAGWLVPDRAPCTSSNGLYSHRCRGDKGRQATVGWIVDEPA